jgi:hypothetical protein
MISAHSDVPTIHQDWIWQRWQAEKKIVETSIPLK